MNLRIATLRENYLRANPDARPMPWKASIYLTKRQPVRPSHAALSLSTAREMLYVASRNKKLYKHQLPADEHWPDEAINPHNWCRPSDTCPRCPSLNSVFKTPTNSQGLRQLPIPLNLEDPLASRPYLRTIKTKSRTRRLRKGRDAWDVYSAKRWLLAPKLAAIKRSRCTELMPYEVSCEETHGSARLFETFERRPAREFLMKLAEWSPDAD